MHCVCLLQYLHGLEEAKQKLREEWATWNPQRAAAKELEQAVASGTITLEVYCITCVSTTALLLCISSAV